MSPRKKLLFKGILFDLVGMVSYLFPVVGPFLDLIWAPFAASQMTKMYPGTKGKVAGVIVFLEELSPGIDIIPTFTLTWLYVFIFKENNAPTESIETEAINP